MGLWIELNGGVSGDSSNNSSEERVDCNSVNNSTLVITDAYQGIPQNLLVNFITWLLLLFLFTILRKKAWNYGRLALMQKSEQRWTQLFYGDVDSAAGAGASASTNDQDLVDVGDVTLRVDKGYFSWITAIFRVKDKHILLRSGPDAIQYLSFQRYIIAYLALLTLISICVVLPINFQGHLGGDIRHFGRTTIANLDPASPLLWIHVVLSVLLFPIGVYFMRRFSVNLRFEEQAKVTRTLMITDIPKETCSKALLLQHFEETYPEFTVQDIQLAYNIRSVMALDREREAMHRARIFSEDYLKAMNQRLLIRPCVCSWMLCCDVCSDAKKEDAITYYSQKEVSLSLQLNQEKKTSLQRPLGICFVTLQTEEMAAKVKRDHDHTCRCGVNPPMSSRLSRDLKPYRWGVTTAPLPSDIYWENLSSNSEHWYLRWFCINFVLFIALFFLTTPLVIITSLESLNVIDFIRDVSVLLNQFLPVLLIWTVAVLMPVLVAYSDQLVRHWTRSSENHTVMRKTFIFLLFMIVILPSLGLTSAKAFVEWAVTSKGASMRWDCVFLPDNGVFYVNYVVTSAFIGTALELIRFPELFLYALRMCATRSIAEQPSVRKDILLEFPFGVQYAWFLLVFAASVIYSISCPLITPFGLVYMLLKHCVDRHNIIFAYGPSKISKSIHATAINFVIVSILLLQLMILFFTVIRQESNVMENRTVVSVIFFCLSSTVFVAQIFFNMFKGFSPILYTSQDNHRRQDHPRPGNGRGGLPSASITFCPQVLEHDRTSMTEIVGGGGVSPRSYGTTANQDSLDQATSADVVEVYSETLRSRVPRHELYQEYEREWQRQSQGACDNDPDTPSVVTQQQFVTDGVASHPI